MAGIMADVEWLVTFRSFGKLACFHGVRIVVTVSFFRICLELVENGIALCPDHYGEKRQK